MQLLGGMRRVALAIGTLTCMDGGLWHGLLSGNTMGVRHGIVYLVSSIDRVPQNEKLIFYTPLACSKTDDGLIVLAEETTLTTLKWLEWATPTEVRRSVVVQSRTLYSEDTTAFFSKTVNRLVSEYPFLRAATATPPLVVRHSDYGYDSPGKNWLALNPTIGSRLGWK